MNEVDPDEWHPTSATVARVFNVMFCIAVGAVVGVVVLILIS